MYPVDGKNYFAVIHVGLELCISHMYPYPNSKDLGLPGALLRECILKIPLGNKQ